MALKKPKPSQGSVLKIKQDVVEIDNLKHPVFCFKYLHKDFCLDQCTSNEKRALINQIVMISQMDWNDLQLSGRHGMGSEKIPVNALKSNIPYTLTDDVKHLLAFRFDGLKSFVGHRNRFIFHVLFIDREYKLYNH